MKAKSIMYVSLVMVLLLSLLAGCSDEDDTQEDEASADPQETEDAADDDTESADDVDDGDYYIELETTDGSVVTFTSEPLVAVMDVAILDIMDALGHEDYIIGVAKRNTGRSEGLTGDLAKYDDDAYLDVSKVESQDGEDVDTYADLRNANPDLIFAGSRNSRDSAESEAESMSEIAPTITFDTSSDSSTSVIETLEEQVDTIVEIYGGEDLAEDYLAQINEKLELIQDSVGGSSAVILGMRKNVLSTDQDMLGTAGTLLTADIGFNSLIEVDDDHDDERGGEKTGDDADDEEEDGERSGDETDRDDDDEDDHNDGGRSGDSGGVDGDMIVELNPDYIIVVKSEQQTNESDEEILTAEQQIEDLGLEACDAYQNGRIIYLDNTIWRQNSGGIRDLIAMLDDMIEVLGLA